MSEVKSNKISPATGTTLTLGDSGDTITTAATPAGTLSNSPAFSVCTNAVTNITAATSTKIVLDREVLDSAGAFASNRFTVPAGEAGKYFISAGINFIKATATGAANIQCMVYLNGVEHGSSDYVITNQENLTNLTLSGSWIIDLAAADYIELWGYISGSGTQYNGNATLQKTHMTGFKLLGV